MESLGDDFAFMQDDDVRTDALHGFELVRTEEHDLAATGELLNEAAENEREATSSPEKGSSRRTRSGLCINAPREDLLAHALRVGGYGEVAITVETE